MANWRKKEIIRNTINGKLYLVLEVISNTATIITSLSDPSELPPTFTLLPREYYKYAKDSEVVIKKDKYEVQQMIL